MIASRGVVGLISSKTDLFLVSASTIFSIVVFSIIAQNYQSPSYRFSFYDSLPYVTMKNLTLSLFWLLCRSLCYCPSIISLTSIITDLPSPRCRLFHFDSYHFSLFLYQEVWCYEQFRLSVHRPERKSSMFFADITFIFFIYKYWLACALLHDNVN